MFTGLVEQLGSLVSRSESRLTIRADEPYSGLQQGESIAVNGCCLTLERFAGAEMTFFTLAETIRRTNLGDIPVSGRVNLERALLPTARLGGHFVQGHVDRAVPDVRFGRSGDGDTELVLELPEDLAGEVVEKGSVALDGVSLTVASLRDGAFSVRLIPETLARTALRFRKAGDRINLETDILGKYVRRLAMLGAPGNGSGAGNASGTITYARLQEAGFLS